MVHDKSRNSINNLGTSTHTVKSEFLYPLRDSSETHLKFWTNRKIYYYSNHSMLVTIIRTLISSSPPLFFFGTVQKSM